MASICSLTHLADNALELAKLLQLGRWLDSPRHVAALSPKRGRVT